MAANTADFFGGGSEDAFAPPAAPVDPQTAFNESNNTANPGSYGLIPITMSGGQVYYQSADGRTFGSLNDGIQYVNSPAGKAAVNSAVATRSANINNNPNTVSRTAYQPDASMAAYLSGNTGGAAGAAVSTRTPGTAGSTFTDSHGRAYQITPQTPGEMAAYNNTLIDVDNLGFAPRPGGAGKTIGKDALTGAAIGGLLGPGGAAVGGALGTFGGAVGVDGARAQQLGSTAQTDAELQAQGMTPDQISVYRSTHGNPTPTGTAANPILGGNPGGVPGSYNTNGTPLGATPGGGGTSGPALATLPPGTGQADQEGAARGDQLLGLAYDPRTNANTTSATNAVQAFLASEKANNQPSEAEALLNKSADRNMAQSLGLAASARGGAGAVAAAQRNAQSLNQATGAQATQDVATLRAQEDAQRRARILSGLGLISNNATSADRNSAGIVGDASNLYGTGVNAGSTYEKTTGALTASNNDIGSTNWRYTNPGAALTEQGREWDSPSGNNKATITSNQRNDPSEVSQIVNNPNVQAGTKKLSDWLFS